MSPKSPTPGATAGTAKRAATVDWQPIVTVGAAVGFLLVQRHAYVEVFAPRFGYLGFTSRQVDALEYGILVTVVGLLVLLLPKRIAKPSDFMLWGSYVLVFAPSMTVAVYSGFLARERLLTYVAMVVLCFVLTVALVRLGPKFSAVLINRGMSTIVIVLISAATYGTLAVTTGLQLRFTALSEVQELRFGYREVATGGLIPYLLPIQAYVVNPTIMAIGLYRRSNALLLAGLFGQLLLYSVGGHRMAILSPVAVFAIYIAYRKGGGLRGLSVLGGLLALLIGHVLLNSFSAFSQFGLVVQRLIVIPPALAAATVEFFSNQEKAYWGYSFMSPFVDYAYSAAPSFLVGAWMGTPEVSANSNFLADGYANAGYVGMIIETLVFVALLWLLDASMRGLPIPVVSTMLVLPVVALSNVSAFTAILTQGVLAAIVLGALLPRDGWRVPESGGHPLGEANISAGKEIN